MCRSWPQSYHSSEAEHPVTNAKSPPRWHLALVQRSNKPVNRPGPHPPPPPTWHCTCAPTGVGPSPYNPPVVGPITQHLAPSLSSTKSSAHNYTRALKLATNPERISRRTMLVSCADRHRRSKHDQEATDRKRAHQAHLKNETAHAPVHHPWVSIQTSALRRTTSTSHRVPLP